MCELTGIVENLPYTCGNLPNPVVTNSNDICSTFLKCVRTTKPTVQIPILFNKNLNVNYCDVINVIEISTHNEAYNSHGERMVITIQLPSKTIVSIRDMITK